MFFPVNPPACWSRRSSNFMETPIENQENDALRTYERTLAGDKKRDWESGLR